MLFDSSIRKDLARNFWASSLVLFAIVMTLVLIRTLDLADRGKFNPEEITLALGYSSLSRLPTILAVALLVAVVSVLARMYRDSEIAIWQGAGVGLWQFMRPLVKFAWPFWLVILLLQLVAWPWANQQMNVLRNRYEQRDDLQRVQPGRFNESSDGKRVFYIGLDDANQTQGKQVFIQATTKQAASLLSAETGRFVNKSNGSYLVVTHGQRIDHLFDDQSIRTIEFDSYSSLVHSKSPDWNVDKADQKQTWQLLTEGTPVAAAELGWRIGMAFMAINFVFLGLAAVQISPRSAKGANIFFAIATAILYFNLLNIGKAWVSTGAIHPLWWLLLLHGGSFLLFTVWVTHRHLNGLFTMKMKATKF